MKKSFVGFLLLVSLQAAPPPGAVQAIASAPLRFEPAGTKYLTRGLRFSSSLGADHMDLRSRDQAMRITFAHASHDVRLDPGEPMSSVSNVIHGNDRTQWRTVPNYATLRARGLYPGVDLVYYGNAGDLEYDLIVQPGGNPQAIRLAISGAAPRLDADGNLSAAFIQKHPVAYQVNAEGSRTPVASRYRRNADGTFGFALGRYDKGRELVIDPVLTFSTFVGGSSQDTIRAIGHDANGFIYVGGITLSTDFEIDPNTMQVPGGPQFPQLAGGYDLFIAQINPTVPAGVNPVAFATYLGGSADDILNDMFVGPSGLVYLTGYTKSTDFPQGTVPGYTTTLNGTSDGFAVVYDVTQPVGSQLVYSTYLGGVAAVAGNGSTNFPVLQLAAVCDLCLGILSRHPIPARNVVAHSDVAPDRKEDPGERFDWRSLAENGVGLWPDEVPDLGVVGVAHDQAALVEVRASLAAIGYRVAPEGAFDPPLATVLRAFQRHWRPEAITGDADAGTRARLAAVSRLVGAPVPAATPMC